MSKILFVTNVIRRMGMMQQTLDRLQQERRLSGECACRWITEATAWNKKWEQELGSTDLLLLKWMGTGLDTPFLQRCLAFVKRKGLPYYIDAAGTDENELVQALTPKQVQTVREYCAFGGERNYYNLWQYLATLAQGGEPEIAAPDPIHWCGIYHPRAQKVYTDLTEYQRDFCCSGRPYVGMLFYRDEWVWGDLTYQKAMVEALEAQGLNPVCVFTNGIPNAEMGMPSLPQVVQRFFCQDGVPVIDALINVLKFSLTGSGALSVDYLKRWNVPVLQAYTLIAPYEEWKNSFEGMNAMEISISISLPEFDGIIHSVPIATKKVLDNGDVRYLPISERVQRMASKAAKWANLRRKQNKDKKIAIIFHNYPPRNSNIGSALGLDTIESVRRVLAAMRERGYRVDAVPEDTQAFIEELTANATNDCSMLTEKQIAAAKKLTGKKYKDFFTEMDGGVQSQLAKDWGDPPGQVMEYDGSLLVPGTMNGNIFITVQPPRGFGEDPEKIYHDPFCAPTHQYLGFYRWLRDVWQADAVAHIGTHGSLEWLPGKNAGLSRACYPDLAIGDLPNIYPYNITITGEGIQAKRRGAACLIEHLPAPQAQAGVYDELEELEKLMDEYVHFATAQPENLGNLEKLVLEKAAQANLQDEVPHDTDKPFQEYVMALHNYITDLKNMEVHTGLHILGEPPQKEQLIEYLWLLLRMDNGDVPSLMQAVAALYGFDYYELLENSGLIYQPLNITYGKLIDRIGSQCREFIRVLADCGFAGGAWEKVRELPWIEHTSADLRQKLEQVCSYTCHKVYPNLLLTSQELENMLRGFEGQYVEPGPSGAPSSGGADLLPTGRNFYGVDPRTLPTPAAWEIGKTLGDQVVERFIAEEGRYPENIGIVLWSGSNMRSHGQCVAEFLYLLGIRPKYQSGSLRVNGLEVIPLTELKRPRIDVTARISGLFRDSMPSVINLLDKAVLLAAEQDEEPELNFVRKHIQADSQELQDAESMSREDAWRQAAYRIFGDQEGTYGAGVAALLEAKNWQTIDDIADVYVRWGAHAYGGKTRGQFLPQQFRKRMGSLDITIKNEDNHETNMLSSDDYNAYHGGMIAAVRSIKGSAPRSYCGDSTDRTRVTMHSVQEEAKRIFRSESINPKYIAGMMQHGYKGAADMANMIAHSFQWDATSAVMEDWMYEKYAEKYTFDPKVQEWLRQVNPWALQRMAEILLEAEQRGLWQAKPETKEELQKLYLDMEGELEDRADER
ncbi:cobaltochelatase subunit CobN [uncultured Phascolarctobacterium sp.]|uniref:cobaltochelatase subunit CobN n=1 Tax=uncultured Phascolarctobacterium sp. TaxID=512296 RepID=UPI0025F5A08B|nr:cobaltochelatase subunit CobN [uncultured Phascolarctobacterium sp.]